MRPFNIYTLVLISILYSSSSIAESSTCQSAITPHGKELNNSQALINLIQNNSRVNPGDAAGFDEIKSAYQLDINRDGNPEYVAVVAEGTGHFESIRIWDKTWSLVEPKLGKNELGWNTKIVKTGSELYIFAHEDFRNKNRVTSISRINPDFSLEEICNSQ